MCSSDLRRISVTTHRNREFSRWSSAIRSSPLRVRLGSSASLRHRCKVHILTPSVRAISLCSCPCLAKSFACASFVATSTLECRFSPAIAACPAAVTSISSRTTPSIAVFWTNLRFCGQTQRRCDLRVNEDSGLVNSSNAINATLYDKLSFVFLRDIVPVAGILRAPLFLVVHPSFPAKTVPEFIAHAKANPGKLSMASPGSGTVPHVGGELFKMMAGIDMTHVPYRGGGQVMTDLIAGQVQVSFIGLTVAIEYIRSGKLRALAVAAATRSDVLCRNHREAQQRDQCSPIRSRAKEASS